MLRTVYICAKYVNNLEDKTVISSSAHAQSEKITNLHIYLHYRLHRKIYKGHKDI